jgi:hypothetical protein
MKSDRIEVVVDGNVGCRCKRLKLVEKWEESERAKFGSCRRANISEKKGAMGSALAL